MQLSLIAAMSENRCIGRNNSLPWHLPDEWAYFRSVTKGKPFIMGRRSYESPDALYSDYRTIVISHQKNIALTPPTEHVQSIAEALESVAGEEEVFVLGGESIFEAFLPKVDKLYITIVHAHIDGDAFFPEIDYNHWKPVYTEHHPSDAQHAYAFSMHQYLRV